MLPRVVLVSSRVVLVLSRVVSCGTRVVLCLVLHSCCLMLCRVATRVAFKTRSNFIALIKIEKET